MGQEKRRWMERLEEEASEAKVEWIREQLDDADADENTEGWAELAEQFEIREGYGEFDDADWHVHGKTRLGIFMVNMSASLSILDLTDKTFYPKNLLVMLHAHVVTAVEAYLSSTFIAVALSSDEYMRKLVETDPTLANRPLFLKDIFSKRKTLEVDLRKYLKEIIFHNIVRAKQMYKAVLGIDFGDVRWLIKAVEIRHHCVHRAGSDRDGNEVALTDKSISELIERASSFVGSVEAEVKMLPDPSGSDFFANLDAAFPDTPDDGPHDFDIPDLDPVK